MDNIVSMLQDGGPAMYLVFLGACLAPIPMGLAWGLGFMKRRVPSAAYALWPILIALVGIIGTLHGFHQFEQVIGGVSPDEQSSLAAFGLRFAGYPALTAGYVAAGWLLFSALIAGVPRIYAAGDDARYTLTHAIAPALLGLVGGVVLLMFYGVLSGGIAVCGGLGVAIAALRLGDTDAARVAPVRLGSAALGVLGGALAA